MKLMPPKVPINMECCGVVVTAIFTAASFRVVCLLLTTSGEVVSFLSRITKKEIYMTKEEFVSYIFDKTVG
ncbi:Uncharacterised protein [Shigella sonnei]|nr:Uncharacterised protein [Shigella sonnei]